MSRRSSRLQDKQHLNEKLARTKRDTRAVSPERSHAKASHKKRKTGKLDTQDPLGHRPKRARRGGKTGNQELLTFLVEEAPLDVLFEILSQLDLKDILTLTRASKDFRSLLLQKSINGIESVWVDARNRVEDLPPKPDEFSEPFFASLMFDTVCMKCTNVKGSYYLYGSRVCEDCMGELVKNLYKIKAQMRYATNGNMGNAELSQGLLVYGPYGYRVHDAQELVDRYVQIVQEGTAAAALVWLSEHCQSSLVKQKFLDQCYEWILVHRPQRREAELEVLREKRVSDILSRLELRFPNMVKHITPSQKERLKAIPGVATSQPLTDQSWAKVKATVMYLAQKLQNESLLADRAGRYEVFLASWTKHRSTIPHNAFLPREVDVVTMKPFMDVMDKDLGDFGFTEDNLTEAWNQFPPLAEELQQAAIEKVFRIASATDPSITQVSDLKLATKLFCCGKSRETMAIYPNVLNHHCNSGFSWASPTAEIPEKCLQMSSWNLCVFTFQHDIQAEKLLTFCGLDPSSTTHEEVLSQSPTFECVTCVEAGDGCLHELMTFHSAIRHLRYHGLHCLRYIDHAQLDAWGLSVSDVQEVYGPKYNYEVYDMWTCKWCGLSYDPDILRHLATKHQIKNPQIDVDYERNSGIDIDPWRMKPLKVRTTKSGLIV